MIENDDDSRPAGLQVLPVKKVCSLLSTPLQNEKNYIGVVVDDELNLYRKQSRDRYCHVKVDEGGISLADAEFKSEHFPTELSKEQCLCLATNLAASVLQFHGTP